MGVSFALSSSSCPSRCVAAPSFSLSLFPKLTATAVSCWLELTMLNVYVCVRVCLRGGKGAFVRRVSLFESHLLLLLPLRPAKKNNIDDGRTLVAE